MSIEAVIFDLDGVIVSTDEFHYEAWKYIADELNIKFNREINNKLRGVSRTQSLEIILQLSDKNYTSEEKAFLLERKNNKYKELLANLSPVNILPDVNYILEYLKENSIKIAIASSSKNTSLILEKINLYEIFDIIADGTMIEQSKPNPEVFLLAANKLGVEASKCIVVEDAIVGVEAAIAANMKVAAIGDAITCQKANYNLDKLGDLIEKLS